MTKDWNEWSRMLAIVAGLATAGCSSGPSIWSKPGANRTPIANSATTTPAATGASEHAVANHSHGTGGPAGATSAPYPQTNAMAANGPNANPGFPPPATPVSYGSGAASGAGSPESGAFPRTNQPTAQLRPTPNEIPTAWASQYGPPDQTNAAPVDPAAEAVQPTDNFKGELLEPAKIVGRVGEQVILAGDIEGTVNIILAVQLKDVPPEEKEKAAAQIDNLRRQLFKQALKAEVNTKLGYLDFMRTVPPEKHAELQKRVKANFEKEFEDVRARLAEAETDEQKQELMARNMQLMRLAVVMQLYELDNLGQLDAQLRGFGSSLDKQVRGYGEQKLQQMSVMRNIKQHVEITHDQMLQYYRDHLTDFAIPAKARWEQLTVRFDRFPNEEAAVAALAEMGNAVYLGGASFASVAKKGSQEPNADDGGVHDWTRRGSLASKPLDEAIFTLPPGKLSQMIRDDRGLHIIRVLERTDASHTPFVEAQVDIKDKIKLERRNQDIQAYFDKVRKSTPVWTIDDETSETDSQASSTAGRP